MLKKWKHIKIMGGKGSAESGTITFDGLYSRNEANNNCIAYFNPKIKRWLLLVKQLLGRRHLIIV